MAIGRGTGALALEFLQPPEAQIEATEDTIRQNLRYYVHL